jgi:hypothetical protein
VALYCRKPESGSANNRRLQRKRAVSSWTPTRICTGLFDKFYTVAWILTDLLHFEGGLLIMLHNLQIKLLA